MSQLFVVTSVDNSKRKKIILLAVATTILVCAAIYSLYASYWSPSAQRSGEVDKASALDKKVQLTQQEAYYAENAGDYSTAVAVYNRSIENATSSEEKQRLLMKLAQKYVNDQKYDDAMLTARQAEKIASTEAVSRMIAIIAELKGDTQLAITYNKKALEQMDKNSPLYEPESKELRQIITKLGGTP